MPTLEERIARLEKAAEGKGKTESGSTQKPFVMPTFDPTAQLSMPKNVLDDMRRAVPNPQAVANDHLRKPTSLPGVHGRSRGKAGENYVEARPLQTFGGERWPRKKETQS